MKEKYLINAGIQLVPLTNKELAYPLIDKVIEKIKSYDLKHVVTPFETIIECEFETAIQIISEINNISQNHTNEWLINIRLHCGNYDILMHEKTIKHN